MLVRLTLLLLKAVCVKYSECLFEDFFLQHAKRMRRIIFLSVVVSLRLMFYTISNKSPFQKKLKRESASCNFLKLCLKHFLL